MILLWVDFSVLIISENKKRNDILESSGHCSMGTLCTKSSDMHDCTNPTTVPSSRDIVIVRIITVIIIPTLQEQ